MNVNPTIAKGKISILMLCSLLFSCASAQDSRDYCSALYADYRAVASDINSERNSEYFRMLENMLDGVTDQCPDHEDLLIAMADVQMALGNNTMALAYYTIALGKNNNNAAALHNKGMLLAMEGDTNHGVELIKKSIAIDEDNLNYRVNYCSTLEFIGQHDESIRVCTEAIEISGGSIAILYHIRGKSYKAVGEPDLAERDFEIAKSKGFYQ